MKTLLIYAIYLFGRVITTAILAQCVLSWIVPSAGPTLRKIYMTLCNFTEPIIGPCRKFVSKFYTGMIDFSPLLAMIIVELVVSVLARVIARI